MGESATRGGGGGEETQWRGTVTYKLSKSWCLKHHTLLLYVWHVLKMFQERRILEETVTCLTPTGLLNQQFGQTGKTPSAQGNKETERGNAPLQKNSQRSAAGNEDQHASKLYFFQGKMCTEIHFDMKDRTWPCRAHSISPQPSFPESCFDKSVLCAVFL